MKTISTALAAHLASETTTLAMCWKLKRRDGVIFGFTSHDRDLVFESVTYSASTGFTPTMIENSTSLSVDNLSVEGMLSDSTITEADIHAGKYDFAEISIFLVNYTDLSQGALKLRKGWLGEVSFQKNQFTAEVRGLTQALSQTIGELYSASCRASLGDARCKVNLAGYTFSATVTALTDRQMFTDVNLDEPTGSFAAGLVTFTTGANAGLSMEIKEHLYNETTGASFTLVLPMPFAVAIGDQFTAVKGCDKTLNTCRTRFSNVVNFRGEPHVPGIDRLLETAGTRSSF